MEKMKDIDISVIIPAFNEENNIEKCLKSVLEQDYPKSKYEVIVVDDESTDKTKKIAQKYADKVITQKNTGPGLARNNGVKNSKGRLLVFLDADTQILSKDLFKEVMKCKKYIGGVPKIKVDTNSKLLNTYVKITLNLWNKITTLLKLNNLIVPVTTCCFYKRKEFIKAGGFRKFSFDDVELWYRARKLGKFAYLSNKIAITSDRKYKKLSKKIGKFNTLFSMLFIPLFETIKFNKRGEESIKLKKLNYFER